MATNVKNKAAEVGAFIDRFRRKYRRQATRSEAEVYINNRWPDLDDSIRAAILDEAIT